VVVDEAAFLEAAQLVTDRAAREPQAVGELGRSPGPAAGDAVEQGVEGRLGAPGIPRDRHAVSVEKRVVPTRPSEGVSGQGEGVLEGRDEGIAERFREATFDGGAGHVAQCGGVGAASARGGGW
jgi:hypothetical protein